MNPPTNESGSSDKSIECGSCRRRALIEKHPWVVYIVPLAVFMLIGSLEPTPPDPETGSTGWLNLSYHAYPIVYSIKILLTLISIALVWPGYRKHPFRLSFWSVLAGVAGVVVWVGLCSLDLEQKWLEPLGLGKLVDLGTRSAYNPLKQLEASSVVWVWGFLTIRFLGLVVVVSLIEEFFLRGFLMRYVIGPDWDQVPFGKVTLLAVVVGTAYPILSHPAELFAAAAWFSLITILMIKTKNIWDCVVAHAVTNLLLGIYVVTFDQWHLM